MLKAFQNDAWSEADVVVGGAQRGVIEGVYCRTAVEL